MSSVEISNRIVNSNARDNIEKQHLRVVLCACCFLSFLAESINEGQQARWEEAEGERKKGKFSADVQKDDWSVDVRCD